MTSLMTPPGSTWTLATRWVLPVSGPPLARGVITIAGERIVAVEPRRRRRPDMDLGDVAVLPGLVNAHTHLDLTGLRGRCAPTADFTSWLRQVIVHRRGSTPAQIEADIRTGLAESLRHGTTLLADISAGGASWPILADAPLRSVVLYELLGLTPARAEESLAAAGAWLVAHPARKNCRPGLSPHAAVQRAPRPVRRGDAAGPRFPMSSGRPPGREPRRIKAAVPSPRPIRCVS